MLLMKNVWLTEHKGDPGQSCLEELGQASRAASGNSRLGHSGGGKVDQTCREKTGEGWCEELQVVY